MIKNIKHFSQYDSLPEELEIWEKRICGLACIKMAIEFFNGSSPNFEELLSYKDNKYRFLSFGDGEEKEIKYNMDNLDWSHYGLIKIANNYNIFGARYTFKNNFLEKIKSLLKDYFIIASVNKNFINKDKNGGHLVVIVGLDSDFIYINDPIKKEGKEAIKIADFVENFSGSIILLSNKNTEWFMSNCPIFINNFPSEKNFSDNLFIHIHENENIAREETTDFITLNGGNILSLHQNNERFIRYDLQLENDEKIFLRIDPNRIFDYENLQKTVLERNSHLPESEVRNAIEKTLKIRNYILDKISLFPAKNYILVHTNKLLNIKDYVSKTDFLYINFSFPENAFVQVSSIEDFEKLKKENINVIFFSESEKDGGLLSYLQNRGIRAFTIESGSEDRETFRILLEKVNKIL